MLLVRSFTRIGIQRRSWFRFIGLALVVVSGWAVLERRTGASVPRLGMPGREVRCTYLAQVNRLPYEARAVDV